MTNLPDLEKVCLLARQAGVILAEGFEQQHEIASKGFQDLVTEVDRRSENFILRQLTVDYPGHTILTEESGLHAGTQAEHAWYIDPLDGTMNYAHNVPFFCVSIGYAYRGELVMGVIFDPMRQECFAAQKGAGAALNGKKIQVSPKTDLKDALLATGFNMRAAKLGRYNFDEFYHFMLHSAGVRRMGSAALEIAYTAAGRLDGMWEMALSAWDVAAGFVIAREAGVVVTNLTGSTDCFQPPYEFVVANAPIHSQMLAAMREVQQKGRKTNEA